MDRTIEKEAYTGSSSDEARLHGNHQLPGQVLYFA